MSTNPLELLTKAKKEAEEKDKARREKLATYFFDLSKLCFTGMVAGLILPLISDNSNKAIWVVSVLGVCLTVLSAMLANKIMK